MPKIIAITGLGGRSGKTTVSLNLSASMSLFEKRNLLILFDSHPGISKSMIPDFRADEVIQKSLLPYTDIMLSGFEDSFSFKSIVSDSERSACVFDSFLERVANDYDYVFLDLPAGMGFLAVSSLSACDDLVIVTENRNFDLEEIRRIVLMVSQLKKRTGKNIRILGILTWGYLLQDEMIYLPWPHGLNQHILKHLIPYDHSMAENCSDKMPICLKDIMSPASISYLELCREIISMKE